MRLLFRARYVSGITVGALACLFFARALIAAEIDRLRCETILGIVASEARDAYRAERRGAVLIEDSEKAMAVEFRKRLEDAGYLKKLKDYYAEYDRSSAEKRLLLKHETAPALMREYAALVEKFASSYRPKDGDPTSPFAPDVRYEKVPQKIQGEHGRMADLKFVPKAKVARFRNSEKVADTPLGAESMVWSSSLQWLLGDYDRVRRGILSVRASASPRPLPSFVEYASDRIAKDEQNVEELPRRILFEGSVGKLRKLSPESKTLDAVAPSAASFDLLDGTFTFYRPREKSNLLKGDWEAYDPKSAENARDSEEDAFVAAHLREKGYAEDLAACAKLKDYASRASVYTGILAKQAEAPRSSGSRPTKRKPESDRESGGAN